MEFDVLSDILGIDEGSLDLNSGQMMLRAFIVYALTIVLIRLGDKRFLGKNTAFDVILGIVLGSVMSRAITGNSAFVPTLVGASVLVALHWLLAWLSFRSHRFGDLIKGVPRLLIADGERQSATIRRSAISEQDLIQALRIDHGQEDLSSIDRAYLERSGDISMIPKPTSPRVIEVTVEDGVQTVRIELHGGSD